jgi:hypothetical protein
MYVTSHSGNAGGIEADYAVYNAIISKTNAQKQEQEQAERRQ